MPLPDDVVDLMMGSCFIDVADPYLRKPGVRTAVYRLFRSDGTLLYVGMTSKPRKRFKEHKCTAAWWLLVDESRTEVEWFSTRPRAQTWERRAIQTEHPGINKRDTIAQVKK